MPLFSIVIPAYNNAEYLPGCLDSLKTQSFTDWEAIVVIDASPDNCKEIAERYAAEDERFVVLAKTMNGGAHLARRDGVAAASGDFITFLDADDEFDPDALQLLSTVLPSEERQIVHFGLKCVSEDVDEGRARSFEAWANSDSGQLDRDELLSAIFQTPPHKGGKDWNVDHRLVSASFAKAAFERMTFERLSRAEDGYEAFVLASLSTGEVTHDEIAGYLYHIGRGVTSDRELTSDRFITETRDLLDCSRAAEDIAASLGDERVLAAARAFGDRLVESAANEWFERVPLAEKEEAFSTFVDLAGREGAATNLMRFARDLSYSALSKGEPYSETSLYAKWKARAEELMRDCEEPAHRYLKYRKSAADHIEEIKVRSRNSKYGASPVRIFVSTHKDVDLFDSTILQPVQVGCANAAYKFPWAFHDDEGDNISDQNPMYCELTTQYWAWKNVDAEYYGFCHYRRYFDFSDVRHKENAWGMVLDGYINGQTQKRYGLDDKTILKAIEGYDVITTESKDLSKFPGPDHTPLAQYEAAPLLHVEDLHRVIAILNEMHPDYAEDAEAFLLGKCSRFCNMFIMRKKVFQDYCVWLFPILERFVEATDFSLYSVEAIRTPGHLAERLFNIYLLHQERTGANLRVKELQSVQFEHPERSRLELSVPYEEASDRKIVPVVFAADDGYVPMVTTTIRSMLDNADPTRFYDVVVLTSNITGEHQELMRDCLIGESDNVMLRFHDVSSVVSEFDLATNNAHIGIETYYRFIIQHVMPEYKKVLYLDSDLVIEGDVAKLYDIELGDNLLAATRDVDYLGNLNMNDGWRLEYTKTKLGMKDPYAYFQAGVLLLNIAKMREAYTTKQWLQFASVRDFIFDDQDVLNAHCQGRVVYLDQAWNVMHDCGNRVANVYPFAPAYAYKEYMSARQHPLIRHYAGCDKPWNLPGCDWGQHYWKYARETPFYEDLIALLCNTRPKRNRMPAPALGENNPIRKVIDPLMPLGSRRREVAKKIGRTLRGRE